MDEEAQIQAEQEAEARVKRLLEQPVGGQQRPGLPVNPMMTPGLLGRGAPDEGAPAMPPGMLGAPAVPPGAPGAEEVPGGAAPAGFAAAALGAMAGGPGAGTPPTGRPVVDEDAVRAAVKNLTLSGKVYLISADSSGIALVITRAGDEPKLRAALEPLGVPVNISVEGTKPEGATRLRGR